MLRCGYIIEYSFKEYLLDDINEILARKPEHKKAFCSQEKLIELLQKPLKYTIWNAKWTNLDYTLSVNPDFKIDILE